MYQEEKRKKEKVNEMKQKDKQEFLFICLLLHWHTKRHKIN